MDTERPHPIRIVIADDHPIFRDGLRRLLEAESDLKVIGEACDGSEAVKLTRQLKPDILLLDLAMPRHPGLEALRDLSTPQGLNSVRVILLTAAAEKDQIVEALQLGALGVVLKDSATQLLIKCIHTVTSGEYWVGREAVSNLAQHLHTLLQSSGEEARQRNFGLTPRELEVVSAVVDGYSNKEIGQHCHIEENTVKRHLSNIFDKLGVSTRLELALFAVNHLHLKIIARVSFVSNPAGADIEVDGKFLGSTPAELPLALGLRTIRVSKKGFKPYQRTVQVLSGGAQRISVDLEPGWQNCFCCGSGTDCRCSTRPLGQGQEAKGRFNCGPQTYHASVGPFKDRRHARLLRLLRSRRRRAESVRRNPPMGYFGLLFCRCMFAFCSLL